MNAKFKPWRLINEAEIKVLQQDFDSKLQSWNDVHALFPLTCVLGCSVEKSRCWAKAQPTDFMAVIKYALFGELSDCFNALTDMMFTKLLKVLFGTESLEAVENPGTPSLILTLCCAGKTMSLYLHPQWVLNALPVPTLSHKPLVPLQDALEKHPVHLQIALNTLSLRLSDIMNLNVGDLVKTDHIVTEPVQLVHGQTRICHVLPGQINSFKSIQITRVS